MSAELDQFPLTGRFLMGRSRHAMSEREKQIVEDLIEKVEHLEPGQRLLARGQVSNHSTMLVEGFIIRTIVEQGRRYIVGIQVPGDFVDLHAFALKRLDHDIYALGRITVGYASHDRLKQLHEHDPHLARLLWFATLLDAAIHRQWTLKLQQLKAPRRVAHMLAEIWYRLDMVELGRPNGFRSPLTQIDLADMCGTTAIHMNRALGELRRANLGEFRRGQVTVPDRAAFEAYGSFDPAYLYGEGILHVEDELGPD